MNDLPKGWIKNPKGYFEYRMVSSEIKEHERIIIFHLYNS